MLADAVLCLPAGSTESNRQQTHYMKLAKSDFNRSILMTVCLFPNGGTPSYLPDGFIERILDTARMAFRVKPKGEITIEANPGDLDVAAEEDRVDRWMT